MFNATMTFDLGEDVNALRDTVHRFAQEKIKPIAQDVDKTNIFPAHLWCEMGDLGLLGMTVPQEDGGTGMGYLAHTFAVEEITRAYVYEVAKACDRGDVTRQDAAACVLYASEEAMTVAHQAVQAMGGAGFMASHQAQGQSQAWATSTAKRSWSSAMTPPSKAAPTTR